MRGGWRISVLGCLALVAGVVGEADAQVQQPRFLPNVVEQFNALARRPDPMGLHIGDGPDPATCRHHQAVIRTEAPDGTPYFIVSRSGPPRDFCKEEEIPPAEGDPTANLYIVRMGSRDKNGERLRSNRLQRDIQTTFTPPDPRDRVVRSIMYDGTAEWPHYDHPGGMQQVGNIVALGVEYPFRVRVEANPPVWQQEDPTAKPILVQFLNVADPEHPELRSTFEPTEPDVRAGVVALTPCGANRVGVDVPCATGHYLLAISGGSSNEFVHFYESTGTDLASSDLSWTWLDTWHRDELVRGDGGDWHAHQTLQFLREGDLNGALYLAGARGSRSSLPPFDFGPDFMDLYRVELEGREVRITWVSSRRMVSHPAWEGESAGERLASFAAASGFHVTPSGELLFYASEHDNDGPEGSNGRGSVKMGEWRHVEMVRPGSPTLAPTVDPGGPYVVDEGSTVLLTGSARPPVTKAWIQLYEDPDYGGRNVVIDYDDWNKDDFDDFRRLDPGFPGDVNGASDEASSWHWFAPVGCTIRANDDDFQDSDFPGAGTRTLAGTGQVERNSDLHDVANDAGTGDVHDSFTSAQFLPDCVAYYDSSQIAVAWDLDLDGTPETTGPAVSFFAEEGPAIVHVPAQGTHSIDGRTGSAMATVTINNVAPSIASADAFDAAGRRIGSEVPFVLERRPITFAAAFSDPGRLDHQAASIAWGDGVVDTIFDAFSDAFGGVEGQVRDRHAYGSAGQYDIALEVTDDDGGTARAVTTVTVVSPVQAVGAIIEQLDELIAATTDEQVLKHLQQARKALAGDVTGFGSDGALHKLQEQQTAAALAHLQNAIADLRLAQGAGADVATLIELLEEVIAALSATA